MTDTDAGGSAPPKKRAGGTNTQVAVEMIKKLIFESTLEPGSSHLEAELADRLGMSRTPVREALLILAAEGLLEVQPRRGVKIYSTSPSDWQDIYQLVTELEAFSASLAARKNHPESDYERIEQAIADMDAAYDVDDREAWGTADVQFHEEIVRLGGNGRVGKIVELNRNLLKRSRSLLLYMYPIPPHSNGEHRAILDAIKQGHCERARTLHAAHRIRAEMSLDLSLEQVRSHLPR